MNSLTERITEYAEGSPDVTPISPVALLRLGCRGL